MKKIRKFEKKFKKTVEKWRQILSEKKALLVILVMGLIPLIWFKNGLLIVGGDFSIPLDPIGTLKSLLHSWYPFLFSGEPNPMVYSISPWFGFWALFKALGLSLLTVNKLWFIFVYMLTGLSMYYLVSVVFEKEKHEVITLVASIFYMFNVYIMVVTPSMATPILYAGLPLILGLYIKGLSEEKSSTKYAVLIGLASLLITSATGNPPIYAVGGIMLFSCLVYHLATGGKKRITRSLVFTLKTAVIFLLINLWWICPYIKDVLISQYSSVKEAHYYIITPGGSPFYETFRLFGSWAFYAGSGGAAYFPFAHYYKTPFFIALTFVIPILAFSAVLFRSKNKYILYFLSMAVIGIFLAHGAHGSSGSIYNFFFSHIPGFWIFREPFAKFTAITAVCFAILIGFSTDSIYRLLISKSVKERYNLLAKFFVLCVIAVILICAWPILTGDLIFSQRGWMKSYHVAVPDYWFKAGEWFNNQKEDFKILVFPRNHTYFYCGFPYQWGYGTADITPYLIHQPLIEERAGFGYMPGFSPVSQELISSIFKSFQISPRSVSDDMKAVLSLINVRYILQRNDVDLTGVPDDEKFLYSPEHIKSILDAQEGIHLEKTFGELDIYKINDEYFLPHIYATRKKILISGGIDEMIKEIAANDFTPGESALFLSKQANPTQWKFVQENNITVNDARSPNITFQKLNPTKYQIKVTNATDPFFLVFSESYHPQWKAYVSTTKKGINWFKTFFQKPIISNERHFIVNGYANAWYIKPEDVENKTNYEIIIEFQQPTFYIGIGISLLTIFVCFGYLGYYFIGRRRK